MLFNSTIFLIFFAIYFILHLFFPIKYRLALIIIGSLVFYSYWNPAYFWIPILLTLIAYTGCIYVDNSADDSERKKRVIIIIAILLIPLLFFKYTNFLYNSILGIFFTKKNLINLPLPLGVSFVTFTLIAYVVDVYRRRFKVERRLQNVAAYVLFFPHLIAGPILRPHELLPQFDRFINAFKARFTFGALIFCIGLIKKIVFADQIAAVVDKIYAAPSGLSGLEYIFGIYGFSLQIYCDFSGYTDMAIGLAYFLGVRLPNNFNKPYISYSIKEFWMRWHITLSKWLRDYLYIPLGGNKFGAAIQARNIFITWFLGGLWHGANWTFIIWGLIHAAGVAVFHIIENLIGELKNIRVVRFIMIFLTFHFVTLAWVFFRAPNLKIALEIIRAPFVSNFGAFNLFFSSNIFLLSLLFIFLILHPFDDHARLRLFNRKAPNYIKLPLILALFVLAIAIGTGSSAKFIYFDF